mmetsp:Transcript_20659/g.31062  ORF Transcript_20659/g.31062 Transcript_20659/m.31062 type:complete len:92 (-) Transcript_20659:46-321(-)
MLNTRKAKVKAFKIRNTTRRNRGEQQAPTHLVQHLVHAAKAESSSRGISIYSVFKDLFNPFVFCLGNCRGSVFGSLIELRDETSLILSLSS